MKINTDASIKGNGRIGYGVVVRGDHWFWTIERFGYCIGDHFDKHVGPRTEQVVEGEIKAIIVGLTIAKEQGLF